MLAKKYLKFKCNISLDKGVLKFYKWYKEFLKFNEIKKIYLIAEIGWIMAILVSRKDDKICERKRLTTANFKLGQ